MDSGLTFSWLVPFLEDFWSFLRGWTLVSGVSMFSFLLALCILIVVIRGLVLKG